MCDDCLEDYYRQCHDCGEYHREIRMVYVDSIEDYVCRDCLEGAEAQEEDDEEENSEANAEEQAI